MGPLGHAEDRVELRDRADRLALPRELHAHARVDRDKAARVDVGPHVRAIACDAFSGAPLSAGQGPCQRGLKETPLCTLGRRGGLQRACMGGASHGLYTAAG